MRTNLSKQHEIVAFLGALCLFFSTLEYLIPKPVPFFRIGLSNLPLLLGIGFLKPADLLLLLLLKVLGQGLMNGTLASYVFLFSLGGSTISLITMVLMARIGKQISLIGISLAGSMASSIVQLTLAILFVFGQMAYVMVSWFMLSGLISGLAIGMFASGFSRKSRWLPLLRDAYQEKSTLCTEAGD